MYWDRCLNLKIEHEHEHEKENSMADMNNSKTKKNTNLSDSTLVKRAKTMIYNGATWEQLTEHFGKAESTLRKKIKASYKDENKHKRLLEKARENTRLAREAQAALDIPSEKEDIKEVIVTETGYLLDNGIQGIMNESLEIFMPHFCLRELDKLTRAYAAAEDVLTMFYSTNRITTINLNGKEILFENPAYVAKKRTTGIVSLCCELFAQGFKVRLLTNSREVADVAELQGCDIQVVLKQK